MFSVILLNSINLEAGITFRADKEGKLPVWTSFDDFHEKHDGSTKDKNPDIIINILFLKIIY